MKVAALGLYIIMDIDMQPQLGPTLVTASLTTPMPA